MPRFEDRNINPYSVPGIVPGFLGIVIAILGFSMLLRSLWQGGFRLNINGSAVSDFFGSRETRRILGTIGLCVVYALGLLGRVHFVLGTFVFVYAFVLLFELKRSVSAAAQWKTLLFGGILALATSASVYAVFTYLFLVNLP
jgi:putative tricarboxylic transport membrane protein